MDKVGRNEECPCGSGKKFKKCCGAPKAKNIVAGIAPEVMRQFAEHEIREVTRKRLFGEVRPEISLDHQGYKFVAVGGRLYYNKRWKFFADFLVDYVPSLFGREWFEGEIAKPMDERHPVMQWRIRGVNYMNKQPEVGDGVHAVGHLPGFLAAYLTFAYDLYIVEHNGRLDERLLQRLKNSSQFQGARHELFAEATCHRAGFEIEHEDERDSTRRHAEFTAIHKATGQKISVEAKSKHRSGVLGQPGAPEAPDELSLRFGKLVNDAIAKKPPFPLVLFLDTNLPPVVATRLFEPRAPEPMIPAPQLAGMFARIRKDFNGKDPINLFVISNHPHHYSKEEDADPKKHLLTILSRVPLRPLANPEALVELHNAANIYGNIPNEFPPSRQ